MPEADHTPTTSAPDPSADLPALLERAATGAKRASERALMPAAAIRRMQADACAAKADRAAAVEHARATAARDAARRGHDTGYAEGFRHGVSAALDPCEPGHTATSGEAFVSPIATWRERRAAAAPEGM